MCVYTVMYMLISETVDLALLIAVLVLPELEI
jgi:hypothetical protein